MSLRVYLKHEVVLSTLWCSKEEFDQIGEAGVRELFGEDLLALLEDLGGVEGLVERVAWEDP